MDSPNQPSTAELLAAWSAVADLEPKARDRAVAALPSPLRERVQAMLDAEARAEVPDLSDVWIGLRGLAQAPPPSGAAPTAIDEFEVVRELGRGAQGVVYEAIQSVPRRRIAVKLLHPLPPDARRRLLDEAERLAALEHPAFPYVVRAGESDAQAFIAMQLVPGRPFDAWARGAPPRRRLEATLTLCDAIRFAHTNGILHRDLKPSNVLVDDDGRLRVIDLGLAAATGAEAVSTAGTLAYMPPERDASAAGDVYAIAVLTWQVLAGALPFEVRGMSVRRAAAAKLAPLPPMPALAGLRSDAIRAVLASALEPDPARRTPTPDALAADLRGAMAARPPSATVTAALLTGLVAVLVALALATPSDLAPLEREAALKAADGQEAEATALLRAATRDRGRSDRLADLWLRHADRVTTDQERRVARVEAWLAAATPALRQRAAGPLADHLVAAQDWDRLAVLLDVAGGGGDALPEAEAALRLARRAWSADDPRVAAIARGTRLPIHGGSAAYDGGTLVIAGAGLTVLDAATLTVTQSAQVDVSPDAGAWSTTLGGVRYVVANQGSGGTVWRWTDAPVIAATLHARVLDVVPDGESMAIALGESARTIRRFTPKGLAPFPMPDVGSDVQSLLRVEHPAAAWIAALGPWEGYLALALDADGRAVGHTPLSGSTRLARLGPTTFAAVSGPRYAAPSSRGADVPAGLHLLELGAGRLSSTLASPGPATERWATRSLHALDLDNDGDTDLAAGLLLGARVATWLLHQTDTGWTSAFVDDTLPLALVPGAAGAPPGLLVRLADRDSELWLLGRGDDAPPPVAPTEHPALTTPRAKLLWAVGALPRLAAELCADGDEAAPAAIAALLNDRDVDAALAALRGAAPGLLRQSTLGSTLSVLLRQTNHPEEATRIESELGLAPPAAPVEPSAWDWPSPAQVRLIDGVPQLLGLGDDATLGTLRFDAEGDVQASTELTLSRMEGGTTLEITLARGGTAVATFLVMAWGGRGEFHREFNCEGQGFPVHVPTTTTSGVDQPQAVTVQLSVVGGRARCAFHLTGEGRVVSSEQAVPAVGAWTLAVRTRGHAEVVAGQVRGALSQVSLTGATLTPAEPGPQHRWVEGQLRAAHAALPAGLLRDILEVDLGLTPRADALLAAPDAQLARHFRRYPQAWLPWLSAVLSADRLQRVYSSAWDWTDPSLRDDEVVAAMLSPVPDGFSLTSREACYFAWQRGRWLFSAGHHDRAAQVLLQLRDRCSGSQTHMDAGLTLTQALVASGREAEAREACATARAYAAVPLLFAVDVERLQLSSICPL